MTTDLEVQRVQSNALQTVQPERSMVHQSQYALARLSDDEFQQLISYAKKGRERIQEAQRALMRPGVHFYDLNNMDGKKKTDAKDQRLCMSKSGAEVLRQLFRFVAVPKSEITFGDGEKSPAITVVCRVTVHIDTADGPVVGTGEGACNTWERKYRYRRGGRKCPMCGVVGTIYRSKFPDRVTKDKGWYCWSDKGGCGANFVSTDNTIIGQTVGDIENPDQMDLLNTIVKMAEKRAKVDATIDATASSDLFTQDLEENLGGGGDDDEPATTKSNEDPDAWRENTGAQQPVKPTPAAKEKPAKDPAAAPAPANPATQARRRFMRELEKVVRGQRLPTVYYSNSQDGRAKREELLGKIFRTSVIEMEAMSAGEWNCAAMALEEWMKLPMTATIEEAVDLAVARSQSGEVAA